MLFINIHSKGVAFRSIEYYYMALVYPIGKFMKVSGFYEYMDLSISSIQDSCK